MSAAPTNITDTYRLELTAEQLAALKTLISWAQVQLPIEIRENEKSEAFWLKQGDGHAEQLALCRQNLATYRDYLAGAQSLVPAVFGARPTKGARR